MHSRSSRRQRKARPELIGPVLTYLPDTLQDAVRMGFLHSSRARGRVPRGLKLAAEVWYLGHSQVGNDATLLRFEVPPFGDAAPDLFTQARLWNDGPQIHDTAFELLGSALDDVVTNRVDSNRYDTGLLQRISRYHRMFGKDGLRRIVIEGTALPKPPSLDATVIASAKALCDATPKPRRVRVAGRLDLIGASQGVLEIHVETGHVVAALWDGKEPIDEIARFFNHKVVCEAPIGQNDLWIAATASITGLTLQTTDRDFSSLVATHQLGAVMLDPTTGIEYP